MQFNHSTRFALKSLFLLGSSAFALSGAANAQNAAPPPQLAAQAQAIEAPEQVLITGSLIRGTAAVGVPVTNLSPVDLTQTGSITIADLFRTIPAANVQAGPVATESGQRATKPTNVDLRGLGVTRELLMVDGMRYPPGEKVGCTIDPSIIPQLAVDRIDVLVDGASAQYGSDAVSGVINIILKRGYDGAMTQFQYTTGAGGLNNYRASALWGRTWDGGDITLSYEWYDDSPVRNPNSNFTLDYRPWGLDNRTPLASSGPTTISLGAPAPAGGVAPGSLGNNCTNCFAMPVGTGVAFAGGLGPTAVLAGGARPAATLQWNGTTFVAINGAGTAGFGTNGTANEFNPYSIAYFSSAIQRNATTMTIDQRLTKDITFVGEAFYSSRRVETLNPSNISPSSNNDLTVAVPTFNPYYPTASAGVTLPTTFQANINMGIQSPSLTTGFDISGRYEGGLRIELPGGWLGRIYYSMSLEHNATSVLAANRNAVSAALGWTITPAAGAAIGTAPKLATWTKPASVPYLNLFCDAATVACNSANTLAYVQGFRHLESHYEVNEKGGTFDGPLFDIPGGTVKAAIGGTYTTSKLVDDAYDTTGTPSLLVSQVSWTSLRHVWAVFTQLNVPIFSEANAIPLFQKLEFEAPWRHDQYSQQGLGGYNGGTSNPKLAMNWQPIDWVTIRSSWGTNFVAPAFNLTDPYGNVSINAYNVGNLFAATSSTAIQASCTPAAGSAAAKMLAGGAPCGVSLPGLGQVGSAGVSILAGLRNVVNTKYLNLAPETTNNYSVGFEFAPTSTFLSGLDIQATWYSIKINNALGNLAGSANAGTLNDPSIGFMILVPSDFAAAQPSCATQNGTPWLCAPFVAAVQGMVNLPRQNLPPTIVPAAGNSASAYWISDGGAINSGWERISGIDFSGSYDWDSGSLGAFNLGLTGTYYLEDKTQGAPGVAISDVYSSDLSVTAVQATGGPTALQLNYSGIPTLSRFRYRARLGWSLGPWSVTGFMNYQSHIYQNQTPPSNVNGNFCLSNGTTAGGTFPCAITGYTQMIPSYYTFDLSIGYDTGDEPANDYLKHVGLQFVVQDLMDKHPPFEYATSAGGRSPAAFDISKPNLGRVFTFIVTKTW